ncbi:pyrophosphatase PpaX [Melghirimyces profundicolus]|uniref:Pyrophosphatase PpaX n=1 Tax=Melghirimyces profundicolus TaxID=1242148 RepID=A0A2T6BUB5_9BACL|nr:pyrophosphatase PpaX [Melghirimyces profundicolus]PTX59644.1 pyrophosphatase PpaX [Melghirimyces profundicolus]
MSYRTVLFDLDGTLLHTTPLIVASFLHTLEQHCPGRYGKEEVLACLGEPLRDQMVRFGGEEEADEMVRTYREHNVAHHDRYVKAFPGVREVVDTLHHVGIQMGVVSNKQRLTVEMGLKLCGLKPWFQTVICFGDTDKPKPDASPIRLALDRLGARAETTLMVGDSKYDLLAARNAGVASAGVAWSAHGKQALLAHEPDHMLESMEDLYEVMELHEVPGGGRS